MGGRRNGGRERNAWERCSDWDEAKPTHRLLRELRGVGGRQRVADGGGGGGREGRGGVRNVRELGRGRGRGVGGAGGSARRQGSRGRCAPRPRATRGDAGLEIAGLNTAERAGDRCGGVSAGGRERGAPSLERAPPEAAGARTRPTSPDVGQSEHDGSAQWSDGAHVTRRREFWIEMSPRSFYIAAKESVLYLPRLLSAGCTTLVGVWAQGPRARQRSRSALSPSHGHGRPQPENWRQLRARAIIPRFRAEALLICPARSRQRLEAAAEQSALEGE